jgi:hypothetical protein
MSTAAELRTIQTNIPARLDRNLAIAATPQRPSDGPRLASEVLDAVASQTASAVA